MSALEPDLTRSSCPLVHRLLEVQAAKTPNGEALEFCPNVLFTYHELNGISNRLARYLKDHQSLGREVVAICLEKTHVLVIAILAVLKAGMAWVPLPMDAPPARIEQYLSSCAVEFVLQSESTGHVGAGLAPCIKLDEVLQSPELQSYPDSNLEGDGRRPTDLCQILFTSGSTGVPKGVMIEHKAAVHNVEALVKQFKINCQTRTLQFAAPTFDIFSLDLFMTFAAGGCVVMAPLSTILGDITTFMSKASITYAQLTPTVIQLIDPAGVPSLQLLASSGEALSQNLASQWRHKVRLFNAYGPTETIVCTIQELSGNQVDAACVGRAIAGLEVRLFADGLVEEVPEGEIGEICVAGPQLFRGYLCAQNELKISECFVNSERYYRTGDIGRTESCPTGEKTLRYLGRRDGQVKIRGIRVDVGDVEHSILTCPIIKQCAAILPTCGSSASHLCSIIVLHSPIATADSSPNQSLELHHTYPAISTSQSSHIDVLNPSPYVLSAIREAKSAAATRLPTHAIPTSWWAVREIPLTSSGKIDRMMLRAWLENMNREAYNRHMQSFSDESQQPTCSSDVEMQLLQSLWAEVLDRPVSSMATDVSFVELGADSLDVLRLISKARKAGLNLNFAQVFAAKTIRGLTHRQQPKEHSPQGLEDLTYTPYSLLPRGHQLAPILDDVAMACSVRVADIEDIYPCTPYQAGLMALDLKCPMSYVCVFTWTLLQNTEIEHFCTAWDNLVASEPVLRNRIVWNASAQDFWQVTIRHKGLQWCKEDFEGPISLGDDLCRGFVWWDGQVQRWKFKLKIHHSIIDGWSLRLMLNRLKSIYSSSTVQQPPSIPFTHFIRYRLDDHHRTELACKRFWSQYLKGLSPQDFPPLPCDTNHEIHATNHQSVSVSINLREMATRYEVTPATILYAAAALILGAHGDSEDVVFGLILAGRNDPLNGIFNMLGPAFVNFPFRTQVDRLSNLGTLLHSIERQVLDILPHQHYGLQRIKHCGTEAAAACQFRCLVVVQPEDENLAGDGLWETVHGQTSGLADSIPLSLELVLGEGQILINCNSDPGYLSPEDVSVLLNHLNSILRSLSTLSPQDLVSQVKLMEKDEQSRMMKWAQDYGTPVDCCLDELIRDSVQRHSGRIAIEDQATQRHFTYHELDVLSRHLSLFLRSHCEVAPEVIIPMALEKSALAIITILAVLKAGCAYVPIDPSWPLERVRSIVDNTQATIILCSPAGARHFRELSQKVVEITEDCWKDVGIDAPVPCDMTPAVSSNLAFVMYTSGSTGVPKGVMLEHRALSTSLTHLARVFALDPCTRHLQFSSFVYDVSVADIFIPLLSGACICVPTEHNRMNRLSATIKDMRIQSAILTPSVVDLISPDDAGTLRTLMTGGEMTGTSLIRRWASRVRLLNAYGPTEASITTTVTDPLSTDGDPSNIGRNVTGWHWIVRRDPTGEIYPAPVGCVGEIAIAGHSLARGYLNNVNLTKQQFVEARQLEVGMVSSRIYLTGDIGRYEVNGTIRIMGRKDRMIKINGVRIEPGESQHQLRQLGDSFASCVVHNVYDDQHNARLAAFVEFDSFSTGETQAHRLIAARKPTPSFQKMCKKAQHHLQELLPRQQIPTLFVPITGLPYSASNKVDLKLLRDELQKIPGAAALFGTSQEIQMESCSRNDPVTPSELALEAAFRQIFVQKHRFTTDVDFFRQGGDSFAAIKLVCAARDHGFDISVHQVYGRPRLADLAVVATPLYKTAAGSIQGKSLSPQSLKIPEHLRTEIAQRCKIPLDEIEDLYPTSSFQEGLAALALEDHGGIEERQKGVYRAKMVFRLAKGVDDTRLNQALEVVKSQNPICRTRLVYSSEGAMQVVRRGGFTQKSQDQEGEDLFRYWIQQNKCKDGMLLVLSIHHALYDAWTMSRLLEDVNHNYAHPNKTRPGLRPYRYFIEYQSTLSSEEARKYWSKQLQDAPLTSFPLLPYIGYRARATEPVEHQAVMNLEYIKAAGISAATVVATAVALILSAYCNMDNICYGMTLSGRDEPELQDIAGPTLSTVPMCINIRRDQTVVRLLKEVQENLLNMRRYQHYGLQDIARLSENGARNASQFRTLLVIQQLVGKSTGEQDDEVVVRDLVPDETSMHVNYPLVVIAQINSTTGLVALRVEYDPMCLQIVQVRRLMEQISQAMAQCTYPNRPVSEIELITTADRAEIMTWNPTLPSASQLHLHQLFEEMVHQQPESPALESMHMECGIYKHLTYRQLDNYATKVCETIRACTSSSLLCAISLLKSPLAVIAMLAVWKAGRAFVMLDPSIPESRQRTILADMGGGTLILTEPSRASLFAPSEVVILDSSHPTLLPQAIADGKGMRTLDKEQLLGASDTAYIIYTSGSSGTPKGVVVSHRAIATSLLGVASTMGLNSRTRMLQFAAFTFDTSMLEIFATLISGGCVCIPSESQRLASELADTVRDLRIGHLLLTPTVAQFLEPDKTTTVESLMLIGESPARHLLENWATKRPTTRLLNGYGPSEASVHSSTNPTLSHDDPHNIGQATACNLFITVPDDVDKLAAIGTIGELIICGNTLADGYLNRPDLTSQAFGVNLPWMTKCGEADMRYYRTGDLARYASDGTIVYLGRKDLQAKIHGQRLELLEIEWQIRRYERFSGCVVDVLLSDLLIAFIMIEAPRQAIYERPLPPERLPQETLNGLRKFLRSVLPEYMVPAIYVPVDNWPFTVSGKIDRRRLRASLEPVIDSYRRGGHSKRYAQTTGQKQLKEVWTEAIPIPGDQIGLDDTIFLLGGDSVTLIRVIAGARRRGLDLSLRNAYQHSTLEAMADSLEGNQSSKRNDNSPPPPFSLIGDVDRDDILALASNKCLASTKSILDVYPCTAMQEALMISSEKSRGTFFNQEVFRVPLGMSIPKLVATLQNVWARHEILRTRIILDESYQSLQVVIDERLEVSLLEEQDLETYLQQDASAAPGYGERLSRCAVVTCEPHSYFILSQHHAVFDGWSLNLLLTDIQRALSEEQMPELLTGVFSSFICKVLDVRQSSQAEQYWKEYLTDLSVSPLPQLKPSSTFEANQKYTLEVPLPSSAAYSLATTAEAAWAILLGRYTETEDVAFGTVRSGRMTLVDDIDSILGPTLVTIPRRLRPVRTQRVNDFLRQVNATIMETLPWEQLGYQNIRKLGHGAQQACKFNSLIAVQMFPSKLLESDENVLIPQLHSNGDFIRADCLTLECQPQEHGQLLISLTYDDRVLSMDDVRWMAYHFSRLLSELTVNCERRLQDVDMAGPDGLKQVQQWNSAAIVQCTKRIDQLFGERAREWTTLTAIDADDATLTYEELDNLSSRLAARLRLLGVSKGDLVPLFMTKSAAMVVTMFAVLKAGAAYVPLAIDSPRERLRLLLRKVSAQLVLCTSDQKAMLDSLPVESVCCDVEELKAENHQRIRSTNNTQKSQSLADGSKPITDPDLAYVIFTSGSAGDPKGVLVDHTALATTILENGRQLGYSKGTKTLLFAAYSFDLSVMEIYLTLLHGGSLFIPNESQRLGNLCRYISEKQIEMALLTPTAIRNLLQSPSQIPSLKTLHSGGEPLPQSILQQWSCCLRLINSYGPTEVCVDACRNTHITPTTDPNNIGYPIGTHLWVVEPANYNQLAPIGCPGELLISGPKLARGYLNDEEQTRKAFIDGSTFPWNLSGEDRFYASGDIVRQNTDGSISFLGRRDLQMKLNGFRIEVEEIEFAIERCDGVTAAIVEKVQLRENGSDILIAFFTMAATESHEMQGQLLPPTDLTLSLIQNACARVAGTLPPYMVPQFYLPINRIPLTNGGKADRSALRHLFDECSRDQITSYRSDPVQKRNTKTAIQRILQGLWAQVLSLDPNKIGLDSEFISLGGESLAAIKLASMCREIRFPLDISLILQNPRLEVMAAHVENCRGNDVHKSEPIKASNAKPDECSPRSRWGSTDLSQIVEMCGIDDREIEAIHPCTPMQEALMAVSARVPQAYIAHERFQLPSSVDLVRFRAAWELVHENNPILRTRICSIATYSGVEALQVVCKCGCDWIETSDAGSLDSDMGLGTSLIRYRVLKSPNGRVFEVLKHHAIYDGFSAKLLWDDFRYAFAHLVRPELRPPYRLYVDYLRSLDKVATVGFWKAYLEGFQGEHFPTLPSPEYIPKASSQTFQTIEAKFRLTDSCQFTFATVSRAAWAAILSTRSRVPSSKKEVCFTATMSGRTAPLAGLEDMMGPTITTVPVRVEVDLDQSIEQYLRQMQEMSISMLPFEHFGLGQIRGVSDAARDACKSPNLLVVQSAQLQKDVLPLGLTEIPTDGDGLIELFGLVVECIQIQAGDSVSLSASYDTSLMGEGEVQHLLRQLFQMIAELNDRYNDGSTLRSAIWNLANGDDFNRMVEWNRTSKPSPSACLHELFEESARRDPDRLAIDSHDGRLSYKELDIAADALAEKLREDYAIKPGDLVPLCFEKSSLMIVAIVGVLKAGAGYVPLDISHPSSRVQYIIRETRARLVVVSPLQTRSFSFPVATVVVDRKLLSSPLARAKPHLVTSRDVAYVTFTSGTSGPPKGVITQHGAAHLSVLEHTGRYQHRRLGSSLRTLQFSSYTFDASVLDIFATMACGGCVCIPSESERMASLEEVLARMAINFADITPTVANLLDPSRVPTLRTLAIGGEMANRALISKWTSSESPLEVFINSYGPTEAAIGCAAGEISPMLPVGHVGKRVGGSLWIVDETDHNHLVPISCVGELVISGPTLAQGYLNDSKRTEAAFIEHVQWLARTGHERIYKTGDLARFDVDGNVEIMGRKEDGQIKLHGLRLELGEIETAIASCPCFSDVQRVAAAKVNMSGNAKLAAFIQLPDEAEDGDDHPTTRLPGSILGRPAKRLGTAVSKAEETLRRNLPEYMIPRLWVPVSSWPLVSSGKTDRRSLAAACEALSPTNVMEYQRSCSVSDIDLEPVAMTKTEKVVEMAWRQVLRKADEVVIRPKDDFFKVGGDSLGAILLISTLRAKGLHITAHEIFTTKILGKMAQLIDSKIHEHGSTEVITTNGSERQNDDYKRKCSTTGSFSAQASPISTKANGALNINGVKSSNGVDSHFADVGQPSSLSKDEERLRKWWASVLHRPEDSLLRHDDFFRCGGDDMAVLHLSRIAGMAKTRLSGADIYVHPILSDMATRMHRDGNDKSTSEGEETTTTLGIRRDISSILVDQTDIEDIFPASHMQMAFLIEGQKWCRAYYAWSFIDVGGATTVAQVQEACNVVTQRHSILRSSFHLIARQCYQAIRKSGYDFKILFYNGSRNQMCTRLDEDVGHPVHFEEILTRFRLLIDTTNSRQTLALGLSHAQYDGFCLSTMLDDLRLALLKRPPEHRTSPGYNRYVEHTQELCSKEVDTFWYKLLKGSRITSITREAVNPRPVMDQSMVNVVDFEFKHSGAVSYPVMVKAAWALVLCRLSRSTDVTFGKVVSGRFAAFEGAQDVIGPCLNLIPTRVRINTEQSIRDLLQQIYEQQVAVMSYESTPLDRIAKQAPWPASMPFASIFQYQNLPDQDTSGIQSSTDSTGTVAGNAVYGGGLLQSGACWLMAWPVADGHAAFRFTFCGETLPASKAESVFDLFLKTLHALNSNLDDKISSALSLRIDKGLLVREDHPASSQQLSHNKKAHPLPSLPLPCPTVLEHLKAIWLLVLHPSPNPSPSATNDPGVSIAQDDSFFDDLGGDSISAAEVAALCANASFELSLQDIIDFPSLRLQALVVSGQVQRPVREKPKLCFSDNHKFN